MDKEFEAVQNVYGALKPLDEVAQARVLQYVSSRLGIAEIKTPQKDPDAEGSHDDTIDQSGGAGSDKKASEFESFAELFDAADPKSVSDKALLAGYWVQTTQASEGFDAASANKELSHLGHRAANITNAVDTLKNQKPAKVIQLKKSGKSQQARKLYKVTVAGEKAVADMLNGSE